MNEPNSIGKSFGEVWGEFKKAGVENVAKPAANILASGIGVVKNLSRKVWLNSDGFLERISYKAYRNLAMIQTTLEDAGKRSGETHLFGKVSLLAQDVAGNIKEKFLFAIGRLPKESPRAPSNQPSARPLREPPNKPLPPLPMAQLFEKQSAKPFLKPRDIVSVTPKLAIAAVPMPTTIEFVEERLASLQRQKLALIEQPNADAKNEFNEAVFQLSKDLYLLRKQKKEGQKELPTEEKAAIKQGPERQKLRDLEKEVEALNPHLPRARDLVKAFGETAIQYRLVDVADSICEKAKIAPEEQEQDSKLFSCTQAEVKCLWAKRAAKAERLDVSLSLVTAIQRTWQEEMQSVDRGEGFTKQIEGKFVVFLPQEGAVYLKEDFVKYGSFKATFLATSFFEVKKKEARSQDAMLQPWELVKDQIPTKAMDASESVVESGTMAVRDVEKPSWGEEGRPLWMAKGWEGAVKTIARERNPEQEKEEYLRECNLCRELGGLPGVWPTHKVTQVDGSPAIIQKAAGWIHKDVFDFEQLVELLETQGELNKEDQKQSLDMFGKALVGVKSLHDRGIVHRDLKLANILCGKMGEAGVTDLGEACYMDARKSEGSSLRLYRGSPLISAPESGLLLVEGSERKPIDTAADMWSVGLLLWQLGTGEDPRQHPSRISANAAKVALTVNDFQELDDTAIEENLYPEAKERGGPFRENVQFIDGEIIALLAKDQPKAEKKEKSRKREREEKPAIDRQEQSVRARQMYAEVYPEPDVKGSLAHLVWRCTRPEPEDRPKIDEVMGVYNLWKEHAKKRIDEGATIEECFEEAPLI